MPLQSTRDLAVRYGAHFTVAVMDLILADVGLGNFDGEACARSAIACIDASRRFHLATEPVAHLWLAGAHALAGDDAAMQSAIDAALQRDAEDPRILADLYGRVLATRAFVRDELDELPALLDTMMVHVRRAPPATSIYPGRVAWAVIHTIGDDDLGEAARAELREATVGTGAALFAHAGDVCDAIARGRAGDQDAAAAQLTQAHDAMAQLPVSRGMNHAVWLLVAGACIRGGWGDPAPWLRQSEAWFADRRLDRLVRRSRTLLAEAGAPVSRRGRGDSDVPTGLRAMGVTSREVDVLKLVVEGRTNKQIAAELYLSPKTVERHLSSLFDRTGVRDRKALAAVGVAHLP